MTTIEIDDVADALRLYAALRGAGLTKDVIDVLDRSSAISKEVVTQMLEQVVTRESIENINVRISSTNLSTALKNLLRAHEIETIGVLALFSERNVLSWNRMGRDRLLALKSVLRDYGQSFRENESLEQKIARLYPDQGDIPLRAFFLEPRRQ